MKIPDEKMGRKVTDFFCGLTAGLFVMGFIAYALIQIGWEAYFMALVIAFLVFSLVRVVSYFVLERGE